MGNRVRRPSPAMIVALIALFISLGGVSWAVASGSIGSREIRNNSIRGSDIRNGTVKSADVGNGSLLAKDFRRGQLPAGGIGPQGPRGNDGAPGAPGSPGLPGPAGPTVVAQGTGTTALTTSNTLVLSADVQVKAGERIAAIATLSARGDGGDDDAVRCFVDYVLPANAGGGGVAPNTRAGIPDTPYDDTTLTLAGETGDLDTTGTYRVAMSCNNSNTSSATVYGTRLFVWVVPGG